MPLILDRVEKGGNMIAQVEKIDDRTLNWLNNCEGTPSYQKEIKLKLDLMIIFILISLIYPTLNEFWPICPRHMNLSTIFNCPHLDFC